MDKLLLRGYVTPEDFSGSDTEKLQAALDYAAKADIRKVVICGDYTADKVLTIPAQTHLVLESAEEIQIRTESSFCAMAPQTWRSARASSSSLTSSEKVASSPTSLE